MPMILPSTKVTAREYLKDAELLFEEWIGGEDARVDGDIRNREPIIALAQFLWEIEHG